MSIERTLICDRCSRVIGAADTTAKVRAESKRAGAYRRIKERKGGPIVSEPDRPYCKPDQSCCDFCCGN